MAINIPYQQTKDRQLNQFQKTLASALTPLTSFPTCGSVLLTKVSLVTGTNTIPTQLNTNLQGWYVVRLRANVQIWDSQDSNTSPSQTLILNASGPVVVDLVVF